MDNTKTLIQRIHAVQSNMELHAEKNGKNTAGRGGNYGYATEADLMAVLLPEIGKGGIVVLPSLTDDFSTYKLIPNGNM